MRHKIEHRLRPVCAFMLPQVGRALLEGFGGHAAHMVHAAGRSAARLVTLMTAALPGFRDHCIYRHAVRIRALGHAWRHMSLSWQAGKLQESYNAPALCCKAVAHDLIHLPLTPVQNDIASTRQNDTILIASTQLRDTPAVTCNDASPVTRARLRRGRQVFLYKRAQIFAGDLWGAFGGVGLGAFDDVDRLTMCEGCWICGAMVGMRTRNGAESGCGRGSSSQNSSGKLPCATGPGVSFLHVMISSDCCRTISIVGTVVGLGNPCST